MHQQQVYFLLFRMVLEGVYISETIEHATALYYLWIFKARLPPPPPPLQNWLTIVLGGITVQIRKYIIEI